MAAAGAPATPSFGLVHLGRSAQDPVLGFVIELVF